MQAELDRGKDYADGLAEQLHEIQGTRLWRLAAAWWRVKAGIRGSRRTVG